MSSLKAQQRNSIIDAKDVRAFMRIAAKNWYFVAVALGVSAVLAYLYGYKLPDVYGARTQILLRDREVYDYQTQMYKSIGYVGVYSDIVNQKRVLTSFDLVNETLNKLDFDVSYFIVGRFKTTQHYGNMPFKVNMQVLTKRLYDRPIDLRILNIDQYELSYDKGGEVARKTFRFNVDESDEDFVIRVDRSPYMTAKNIQQLAQTDYQFVRHERNRQVNERIRSIKVNNQDYTTILEVTTEDEVPERAKLFLDSLSAGYIRYTLKSEYEINENTVNYIDRQLAEVTVVLDQHEREMLDYKEIEDVIDMEREEGLFFNEMVAFDKKRRELEMEVQSLNALEHYVLNSSDERLLPPASFIIADEFLRDMLTSLVQNQMERNSMLFSGTALNMAVLELDSVMRRDRASLLTYINNAREARFGRIKDVQSQIADYERILRRLPKKERDMVNIKRRLTVNERLYTFLLEKRASTIIARAGIVPQTKVIETARGMGVVRPDKAKILYTFMLGGVVVAMLVVFIRVMFYDRIENADQLKELTPLPIYGEIIASEKAEQNYVVVDSDPKAAITESFRTVRTNLEYVPGKGDSGKVVMLTSYRPNEGKTFCSVNLSAILAKAGKRVLLLELDLHKPKVATGLGMSSTSGLSNVLIGKLPWRDAVMPTQFENFFVMLSGPTPPNASELVLSKRLEELLVEARREYDYVLIDTPPVGLITDALLMMRYADCTMFVVNTQFASKDHVNNALDVLQSNQGQNVGFILNGVRMKKSKYYYNTNYGYGYRYAYGYGSGYGYGYGYGRKSRGKREGDGKNQSE
ncbi:MAG TPA: polysaccharide biosynthesis tyrosine autokinase [Flavobacteriales bacterium]|nr:polysaccharide biosynthesis tyrosine autokinase [Flavobacteriales bacterium]